MRATEVIKIALKSTQEMLNNYVSDLSDADLLVRPCENANHVAWQVGHLLSSEKWFFKDVLPAARYPEVPEELGKMSEDKKPIQDPPGGYPKKAKLLEMFNQVRNATLAGVDGLTDADLDKPTTGPMAKHAPTLAALLQLTANHTLMHAGQFTVVRRKLGKPVLF